MQRVNERVRTAFRNELPEQDRIVAAAGFLQQHRRVLLRESHQGMESDTAGGRCRRPRLHASRNGSWLPGNCDRLCRLSGQKVFKQGHHL